LNTCLNITPPTGSDAGTFSVPFSGMVYSFTGLLAVHPALALVAQRMEHKLNSSKVFPCFNIICLPAPQLRVKGEYRAEPALKSEII
jgi:hypothetical protein